MFWDWFVEIGYFIGIVLGEVIWWGIVGLFYEVGIGFFGYWYYCWV